MRKKGSMAFLAFCAFFLFATVSSAEVNPAVMIILDASGSMWGSAGKETKIEAARKVLSQVVPGLPQTLDVGFMAFGHRRTGDCGDMEILVPLGSGNREEILEKAKVVNPKGKTPLALSVERMAETLRERDGETTIILVSDGKDTCSADPCETVEKLRKSGIRFVLHVVGFAVQEDVRQQLECMAKAGGGAYYSAEDADSLLGAFAEMAKEIDETIELVPAETKRVEKKSALAKLRIAMPENASRSLGQYVILGNDGKTVKTVENPKADMVHTLPSGEYRIVMGYANPNYQPPTEVETFSVKAEGESSVLFGALGFALGEHLGEAVSEVIIRDGDGGSFSLTNKYHGNGSYLFTPKPLPAGVYDVLFAFSRNEDKPVLLAEGILVEALKESVLQISSGILIQEPRESVEGWDLVPVGKEVPLYQIRRRWDNDEPLWRHFPVPPGTYDLFFHVKGMEMPLPVGEGMEILAGELVAFDSGM